ncbi:MAG: hypothetical protein J0M00_01565 [Burkholderiales bacterium]|nr:hypothetical protein [Burkholderiales bacterium]
MGFPARSAFAVAAFVAAASVQAAPGFGYQDRCYATKAEALAAFCRGEFPKLSLETDESVSANTWSLLIKVATCQSVTAPDTLNLWWNRPGQNGQGGVAMKLDNWPPCDTDNYFGLSDALLLGWGIGTAWILTAAALRMRKAW